MPTSGEPTRLGRFSEVELRELIDKLVGHGGYSPLGAGCLVCKLKDDAREELEKREAGA